MRTIISAIFFICNSSVIASAQEKKTVPKQEVQIENIFTRVEIEAHTDPAAWHRYLHRNLKLDSTYKDVPPGCYTVVVSFVVDIYGGITDVKVVSDPGYGLGQVAAKAVRNYKGKWTPASQCGRLVKSYKKQPIIFTLTSE